MSAPDALRVAPGQVWRHLPSDDVRIVLDIVTYKEATSGLFDPREGDPAFVARMIHEGGGRDCRDSSDMDLAEIGGGFTPRWPATWELVSDRISEEGTK